MIKRTLLLACAAFLLLAGGAQAQTATLDGITYTVNEDGQTASVTGYAGEPADVAIPATVNINGTGYAVTAIGDMAFISCFALQSATFPEGLQTIGTGAFADCASLQSIDLPEGAADITVYGQSGAPMRHAAGAASLSLEGLPHGLYIICVAQGGQRQVLKVVR